MLWFLFFPGFFGCRRPILYFCAVFDSRVKIPNKKKYVLSKWTWKNHQTSKKFRRLAKVGKASDNDQSCSEYPFWHDLSKNHFARVVRDKVNDFTALGLGPQSVSHMKFVTSLNLNFEKRFLILCKSVDRVQCSLKKDYKYFKQWEMWRTVNILHTMYRGPSQGLKSGGRARITVMGIICPPPPVCDRLESILCTYSGKNFFTLNYYTIFNVRSTDSCNWFWTVLVWISIHCFYGQIFLNFRQI